jgi:hypothetical protein
MTSTNGPDFRRLDTDEDARDADSYRYLRDVISASMVNPDLWDGEDSEPYILAQYVRWLAAGQPVDEDGYPDRRESALTVRQSAWRPGEIACASMHEHDPIACAPEAPYVIRAENRDGSRTLGALRDQPSEEGNVWSTEDLGRRLAEVTPGYLASRRVMFRAGGSSMWIELQPCGGHSAPTAGDRVMWRASSGDRTEYGTVVEIVHYGGKVRARVDTDQGSGDACRMTTEIDPDRLTLLPAAEPGADSRSDETLWLTADENGPDCPRGCEHEISAHRSDVGCVLCDCIHGRPSL